MGHELVAWYPLDGNLNDYSPYKGKNTIKQAVALNTAAVLYLSGKTRTLKDGYAMSISSIESGKALEKLKEIQKISSEL